MSDTSTAFVASALSDYLSTQTGATIVFESAIVPKWKDSRISFKNVYISRRPASTAPSARRNYEHSAALGYDVSSHPAYHQISDDDDASSQSNSQEDDNFTQFDLAIDSVDVTFSLWRYLDGKGLVKDAVIKGVRGVLGEFYSYPFACNQNQCWHCLDRRSVSWDPEESIDPRDYRHPHTPGDFELESCQVEDLLITVYQPDDFRPFTMSVFRADLNRLRKQWLFYDILCAENIVGQFDNCLFSLHQPQSIGRTTEKDLQDGDWSRMVSLSSRLVLNFTNEYT